MVTDWPQFIWMTSSAVLQTHRSGPSHVSRLRYRVGLLDIDMNLHLTNSRYLYYMDMGRWDLVLRTGRVLQGIRAGLKVAVVELDVKFRKELKPFQAFQVDTRIVEVRNKLVTFEQHFLVGDRIHTRATVKALVLQGGKVIAPDAFEETVTSPLPISSWQVVRETPPA